MDEPIQPTCWAGQQAIGTLLGTMFGFVSAAILTPTNSEGDLHWVPAAPGVVIGSSLGVLAAHAGGESSQTPQELMYLLVLSVVAAAVMAAISSWLAGDMLEEAETAGVVVLATISSLGCTAVFAVHDHNKMLRVPMAEDRGLHSQAESNALMDPKEV